MTDCTEAEYCQQSRLSDTQGMLGSLFSHSWTGILFLALLLPGSETVRVGEALREEADRDPGTGASLPAQESTRRSIHFHDVL